jgi:uncharacterized membrane protein YoaK (UPF0700 family)
MAFILTTSWMIVAGPIAGAIAGLVACRANQSRGRLIALLFLTGFLVGFLYSVLLSYDRPFSQQAFLFATLGPSTIFAACCGAVAVKLALATLMPPNTPLQPTAERRGG